MAKNVAHRWDGDLATELVSRVRIASAVLCRSMMAAPWGFAVPERSDASFHLLLDGEGWLEIDGLPDPIPLRRGDLAVLPRGNGHRLKDSRSSQAPPLTAILATHELRDGELRFGGRSGPQAEVVCGVFSLEGGRPAWLERLPAAVIAPGRDARHGWRRALATALRDEARAPTPGGAAVVNRWLESIVADALRSQLAAESTGGAGSISFSDDRIGRALASIHERPADSWSVGRLSEAAVMSRSAFAARFRAVVGEPPARYLRRVRLERADRLLRTTDATIAEIARAVGYGSEHALSHAFKADRGVSPNTVRGRTPVASAVTATEQPTAQIGARSGP